MINNLLLWIGSMDTLDYIWRWLVVGSAASTCILFGMSLILLTSRRFLQIRVKYFLNVQFLLLSLVWPASLLSIALYDRELAAGCFRSFLEPTTEPLAITRVLAAIWTLTALSLFFRDGVLYVCAVSRKFHPLTDTQTQKNLQGLATKINLRRHVDLGWSEPVMSPFAYGFFRHRIVLPLNLLAKTEDVKNILAHELVHVRDFDSVWQALAQGCERVLFFHPLMYWVNLNYRKLVERAADEEAVRSAHISPRSLLKTLITVASDNSSPRLPQLAARKSFSELKERMESLGRLEHRSPSWWWLLSVSIFSAALSVAQGQQSIDRRPESATALTCSQAQHERFLDSWLNLTHRTNQCQKTKENP